MVKETLKPLNLHLLHYILTTIVFVLLNFQMLALMLINIDRLLVVHLNIKYPLYITNRRTVILIVGTWTASSATCVGVLYIIGVQDPVRSCAKVASTFIYPIGTITDSLYVTFTVIIYSVIFSLFAKSRRGHTGVGVGNRVSLWKAFRESRFYMAFLLVLSYTTFIIIPDIVLAFMHGHRTRREHEQLHEKLSVVFGVTTKIALVLDAVIFLNMDPSVRNLLRRRREMYVARKQIVEPHCHHGAARVGGEHNANGASGEGENVV